MPPLSRPVCKGIAVGPVIRNGREVGSRRAFVVGVCHLPDVVRIRCYPQQLLIVCGVCRGVAQQYVLAAQVAVIRRGIKRTKHQPRHCNISSTKHDIKKVELKQAEGPTRKL